MNSALRFMAGEQFKKELETTKQKQTLIGKKFPERKGKIGPYLWLTPILFTFSTATPLVALLYHAPVGDSRGLQSPGLSAKGRTIRFVVRFGATSLTLGVGQCRPSKTLENPKRL